MYSINGLFERKAKINSPDLSVILLREKLNVTFLYWPRQLKRLIIPWSRSELLALIKLTNLLPTKNL
jgi:hypothetical protein